MNNLEISLIGRTVIDPNGIKGIIISAIFRKQKWNVSVKFEDRLYTADNRFTLEEWFQNSY